MDKYLRSALTLSQTVARAQHFISQPDNLKYDLFLKLKKGETYEGSVNIEFNLQKTSPNFFIDYAGTLIKNVTLNGTQLPSNNNNYEGIRNLRFLQLSEEHIKEGKNELSISFENVYTNDRVGLHSFVDTDGLQYIYSQGEAYGMNKIFPCFDQPDLKAPLKLLIATPKDWISVANQPICKETTDKVNPSEYLSEQEKDQYHFTAFLTTPRLSTYLYGLAAGPYDEIRSEVLHKNIPMSCYVRKTLTKYLKEQADEIFAITREAINFYETYFNYPYPFLKYDYVFYPETYFGGMENPGLVVIRDVLIWKEAVFITRNTRRCTLLTHEASHLWFGDLVTMKWWNDLWLNESFADFMCFLCFDGIKDKIPGKKYADCWTQFFANKGWGYDTDQLRTTHPIAGQVLNTDQAETVFDGITYSKGAATIQQLIHLIGKERFGEAMSAYFKKHEWANASLNDFILNLQDFYQPKFAGSIKDLGEWKTEFLDTAGLNEVVPLFDPSQDSPQSELIIHQKAVLDYHPTLRHHKMRVAFFNKDLEVCEEVELVLNNSLETRVKYDGSKKPVAVFLNYRDEAFVKVGLDENSLAFFGERLHLVKDELTKSMLWRVLFEMVRDGKLAPLQYVEIASRTIPKEEEDGVVNFVYLYLVEIFKLAPKTIVDSYLKPTLFECTLETLLNTDKTRGNKVILLRDKLISLATCVPERGIDNIERIKKWFDGEEVQMKGLELTTQSKWAIVEALQGYAKLTPEERKGYVAKMGEVDKSNTFILMESKCEAIRANAEARKALWESYLDPNNKLSLEVIEASMEGYNNSGQCNEEHEEKFFGALLEVFKTRGNEFAQSFYGLLFPKGENIEGYIKRVEALLEPSKEYDWLVLSLKQSLDFLENRKRVRECCDVKNIKDYSQFKI